MECRRQPTFVAFVAFVAILTCVGIQPLLAQRAFNRPFGRPNAVVDGMVTLPYMMNDNAGNQWRIFQNGWLQQVGNQPIYSQGASILINGNQPAQQNNQARIDNKTGELVMENLGDQSFSVTRRIFINKDDGYVRYIDIIKNTQGQEQTANITIQSNLNFGIQNAQTINDPKKKDHAIGWVAQTGAGPSAVECFAGRGAKLRPPLTGRRETAMCRRRSR